MSSKRVYSSVSAAMAWHIRNVLEQHDIVAEVKNANLYSVAGEIPFTECWPEVWVKNTLDCRRALQIIEEALQQADNPGADWHCPRCSEISAGNFDICWQCQCPRQAEDSQ